MPLSSMLVAASMSANVIIWIFSCQYVFVSPLVISCVISCLQFTENMVTAQKRDAARQGQFYFRKNVTPPESDTEEEDGEKECAQCCPDEYTLMSADTIINGKVPAMSVYLYTHLHYVHTPQRDRHSHNVYTSHHVLSLSQDGFPGLIPFIRMYLNSINIDVDTRFTIRQYLSLISQRASGTVGRAHTHTHMHTSHTHPHHTHHTHTHTTHSHTCTLTHMHTDTH